MQYGMLVGNVEQDGTYYTDNFNKVIGVLKEIGISQKSVIPLMEVYTKKWNISNTSVSNCIINGNDPEATL